MHDVIIIGAGASGLFCWMLLPKQRKKLILEKTDSMATKLLLSGKGRCNFTNLNTSSDHYLGDQRERLSAFFQAFWPQEMINFLRGHGIESKEEDAGRILLESNKSRQLVDFLIKENEKNATTILTKTEVLQVERIAEGFSVKTPNENFTTKRMILASGGCSFPQIGGGKFAFSLAKEYKIATKDAHPALCGIQTQEKIDQLSGSSTFAKIQLLDWWKCSYETQGDLLFTHEGISWPAVFNTSLRLGYQYGDKLKNLKIRLIIPESVMTKRLFSYLRVKPGFRKYTMTLTPIRLGSREKAKVMSGGILFEEVDEHLELKKLPWVFVIGESLNVTGETWGFNLQRCWTSSFACATYLSSQDKSH